MKKTLSQLCFLKTTRTTLDNFFPQSFLRSLRDISTAHLNFVRRRNKNGLRTKKICTADEIYFDCGAFFDVFPRACRDRFPCLPYVREKDCLELLPGKGRCPKDGGVTIFMHYSLFVH